MATASAPLRQSVLNRDPALRRSCHRLPLQLRQHSRALAVFRAEAVQHGFADGLVIGDVQRSAAVPVVSRAAAPVHVPRVLCRLPGKLKFRI